MVPMTRNFSWVLLLLALLLSPLFGQAAQAQTTYPAASCNETDVASAIASAVAGGGSVIVTIPAGTCTWSGGNLTTPASGNNTLTNITIIGAGNTGCPSSCNDATVIQSNGSSAWYILPAPGSTTVRLSGITFKSTNSVNGIVHIQGSGSSTPPQVRVDHIHGAVSNDADTVFLFGSTFGVVDHMLCDEEVSSEGNCIRFYDSIGGDSGDQSWANPTGLGGPTYMYVENSTFNHGVANDGQEGARFVFRFDTFNDTSVQTHPTGGDGRGRGARAWELYNNTFNAIAGCQVECGNAFWMSSGTGVVWGNSANSVYGAFVAMHSMRISNSTYPQTAVPNGWGYCGTGFNGTGSPWDQNSTAASGYACLDQPGQGIGQLLSGNFPNVKNTSTGTIAWPHQALEPVYEWLDAWTGSSSEFWPVAGSAQLQSNRDFYLYCSPSSSSGCTSTFNGTAGTGSGPLASMPSSCTAGVAYWATDQGNWNQSGVGGQGVLYKCTSANTWSTFYTPYTYPHPLITSGSVTSSNPPAPPASLEAVVN
jgi:hypothetical protein